MKLGPVLLPGLHLGDGIVLIHALFSESTSSGL